MVLSRRPITGNTLTVLFTEAARFQSWGDVEAALTELTIIPAEMRNAVSTEYELAYVFADR
jgi:hypothetical protein